MTLLKTLPRDLSQDLILRLGSFGPCNDLKEHAKQRSELRIFVGGKSSVHHIDIQQASSDEGAAFVDINEEDVAHLDQDVLAMFSKVFGNRIRCNTTGKWGKCQYLWQPNLEGHWGRHTMCKLW